ncbi:MAG: aldo/keto reductase [Chloroherpetonaceae bacterium]|nr:aldo/keto reductase [Chloroherpetonaceae bacterium]
MKFKTFGRSGLRVSEISLGTMTFGEDWGWGSGRDESERIFNSYTDLGGNFIDTADGYTSGTSEKMVGEFMKGRRTGYVIATKYTFNFMNSGSANGGGNHRKNMIESLHGSLKRLATDYIDVYWVHRYDPLTPIDEMMRALDDMVKQGKVLYIGISDAPAWTVSYANALAELRGWSSFLGLQIEYSLAERTVERELLPMAEYFKMAVAAWSPLAGGLLSGKYTSGGKTEVKSDGGNDRLHVAPFTHTTPHKLKIADSVVSISKETGLSAAQVSLRWLMQKSPLVIPIIGARKMAQFTDNMKAAEITLSEEQMNRLSEVSAVELGFPHNFLKLTAPSVYGDRVIEKLF